jgi:superfamily II DNA or RNA helicase
LTPRQGAADKNLPEDDARNAMLDQRVDLDRVAASAERNERILTHLGENRDSIQHALIFAASVDHAEALAAVLSATGISAASISGKTGSAHRRNLIERFRRGDIKVLTNFDVLSQGFDAPKVDAVYLCRPTFSPNKYIQMVGRGLRGPANGGSQEVLVVNIQDNFNQFGAKLAYTEFDYLWNRAESRAL